MKKSEKGKGEAGSGEGWKIRFLLVLLSALSPPSPPGAASGHVARPDVGELVELLSKSFHDSPYRHHHHLWGSWWRGGGRRRDAPARHSGTEASSPVHGHTQAQDIPRIDTSPTAISPPAHLLPSLEKM